MADAAGAFAAGHVVAVIGAGPAGLLRRPGARRPGLPRPPAQSRRQAGRARRVRHLSQQVQDEVGATAPVPEDPHRSAGHVSRERDGVGPRGPRPSATCAGSASTRSCLRSARRAPSTSASKASGSPASITPRTSSTTTTGCRPSASSPSPWAGAWPLVGVGNVMVDIANYCVHFCDCDAVIAVARRGPFEKAYDDREFEDVEDAFDRDLYRAEILRIRPRLEAAGQDPDELPARAGPAPRGGLAHSRAPVLPLPRLAPAGGGGGRPRDGSRGRGDAPRAEGRPGQRRRHRRDERDPLRYGGVRGG